LTTYVHSNSLHAQVTPTKGTNLQYEYEHEVYQKVMQFCKERKET